MLRFALGLQYFSRFHFVLLFAKNFVGLEICVLALRLHVFCFQLEGGVKSLRTGGLKILGLGGGYRFGGGYFCWRGGQYPITCDGYGH